MATQTMRRLLRVTTFSFVLASGILAWRAMSSPEEMGSASSKMTVAIPRNVRPTQRTLDLEDFAPLLDRRLGAPLYEPSPKSEGHTEGKSETETQESLPTEEDLAKAEPQVPTHIPPKRETPRPPVMKPQSESIGLRLMGTMIEAGGSIAILANADGSVRLAKVGDSMRTDAGDAQIDKIELEKVTLSIDGDAITLKVPR